MTALCDHDPDSLAREFTQLGHNPFHAQRILRDYYSTGGKLMVDRLAVSRSLRLDLSQPNRLMRSRIAARQTAKDGTIKLLIAFDDGATVESVLMPAPRPDRAAGCISSQVGCAMGCDFCASTKSGLSRNLLAGEIVEQFLHLRGESNRLNRRLASIVFMGIGEPMHNLDAVIPAIRRIADPTMGSVGWRHVTVSTVGIIAGIERLQNENLGVHLALSLHATDDETRRKLVPTAKKYSIAQILDAARRFQERSGRITTIEYCLLAGVNDSDADALRLAELLTGWRPHVNLIPFNFIGAGLSGAVYHPPSSERVATFARSLAESGVVVHIRRPRGDDIAAACGQLREQLVNLNVAPSLAPSLSS